MKKLLLLIVALATTCGVFADEWQKPVYSGGYQPLTTDEVVSIYNTEAQMFLTEGNDWGTHASVGNTGLQCTISEHAEEGKEWDGKTYAILVASVANDNTDSLFITDGGNVYVDCKQRGNSLFYFNSLGNNTYQLTAADANATWNTINSPGYLIGRYVDYVNLRDEVATGTGVIFDDPVEMADKFQTTWAFVSEEDYAGYLSEINRYETAQELKEAIENAEAEGVTDLAAEKAVYANTASTEDELNDAIESVAKKVLAYYEQSVTPDNPKEIERDDCNSNEDWTNELNVTDSEWAKTGTWTDAGWVGYTDTYLSLWSANMSGRAYKQLEGLPNGVYVVNLTAYSQKADGYVFANLDKKTVATNAPGAVYEITTNVTDGTLEYGFGQDTESENWIALDNAVVTYYGNGTEAIKYWVNSLKDSAPDFSDATVQPALVEAWNDVMKEVESATTDEEILAVIPKVEEALDNINQNIAAYNELQAAIDEAKELLGDENINEKYGDALSDASGEKEELITTHTLSTEEVQTQTTALNDLFDEAQNYIWQKEKLDYEVTTAETIYEEYKEECAESAVDAYNTFMEAYKSMDWSQKSTEDVTALVEELYNIEFNLTLPVEVASDDNPVDYTPKVQYPSFDGGAEGWTNDGWSTCGTNDWNSFADGTVLDALYLNLWNPTTARVYQTITNLPAGTYMLQIGAFANAEGLEVYAGEDSQKVKAGQNDEEGASGIAHIYDGSELPEAVEGEVWYGNLYQIITKVGEDGILEIGARNVNESEIWAMIDNVKLTYYGTESTKQPTHETAIASVKSEKTVVKGIYTLSGTAIPSLQKGINIVKYSDGSVKKVFSK